MKKIVFSLFLLIIANVLLAQDSTLVQKTYVRVVKEGLSTAPNFIVISIKNLNNGRTKEICTDMGSLYESFIEENIADAVNNFNTYLLARSKSKEFDFHSIAALKTLDFDSYTLHDAKQIDLLIKKNHLRDSLKKINQLEEMLSTEFYKYEDIRDSILEVVSDSITKIRKLSDEESKMKKDLHVIYYDKYYTDPIYNKYRTVSAQGREFMAIWSSKIKKYGGKYFELSKEITRLNKKFFADYYKRYGLNFCNMAFKNGIITYIADESGIVSYGGVVN